MHQQESEGAHSPDATGNHDQDALFFQPLPAPRVFQMSSSRLLLFGEQEALLYSSELDLTVAGQEGGEASRSHPQHSPSQGKDTNKCSFNCSLPAAATTGKTGWQERKKEAMAEMLELPCAGDTRMGATSSHPESHQSYLCLNIP